MAKCEAGSSERAKGVIDPEARVDMVARRLIRKENWHGPGLYAERSARSELKRAKSPKEMAMPSITKVSALRRVWACGPHPAPRLGRQRWHPIRRHRGRTCYVVLIQPGAARWWVRFGATQ